MQWTKVLVRANRLVQLTAQCQARVMSVIPPLNADIHQRGLHVRFGASSRHRERS